MIEIGRLARMPLNPPKMQTERSPSTTTMMTMESQPKRVVQAPKSAKQANKQARY